MTGAVPNMQVPGIYRCRIGDTVVTAVNDGSLMLDPALLLNITLEEAKSLLRAAGRPDPLMTAINAYVVQTPSSTMLIDTGAGSLMGSDAGRLQENLAAAGVTPDSVDAVLMTHLHIDHAGGLLAADGEPAFRNADLLVSQAEADFWLNEANTAAAPEAARATFALARRATDPYRARLRLRLLAEGETAFRLESVPLHGHTPGHTGYKLTRDEDRLLIWGDIVHMPDVQCRRPDVGLPFDSNPAQATATRQQILAVAAQERFMVAGMHLHFPGFMRIAAEGGGYVVQPVVWQPTL